MKWMRNLGIITCLLMCISVFLPWVYVAPVHQTFTGMNTGNSNFGKPGILDIFFAAMILIFILINRIWSTRTNLILAAFLVAWCIRNYILLPRCEMGYCPEKLWGLYVTTICGIIIFVTVLFPVSPKNYNEE